MAWPETLPKALANGYGIQSGDCAIRTDMESGAARVRRRSTSAPDKVSLKFLMTDAQMVIFRAFYTSDFKDGAAWVSVPIMDGRTAGVVSREVRPTSPFKADWSAPYWLVEMPVEVRVA
jgi:hypothetical protein